jgi:hypothetical protein
VSGDVSVTPTPQDFIAGALNSLSFIINRLGIADVGVHRRTLSDIREKCY